MFHLSLASLRSICPSLFHCSFPPHCFDCIAQLEEQKARDAAIALSRSGGGYEGRRDRDTPRGGGGGNDFRQTNSSSGAKGGKYASNTPQYGDVRSSGGSSRGECCVPIGEAAVV